MAVATYLLAFPDIGDSRLDAAFDQLAKVFSTTVKIKGAGQSQPVRVINLGEVPDDTMLDLFKTLMDLQAAYNVRCHSGDTLLGTWVYRPGLEAPLYFEDGSFEPEARHPNLSYSVGAEVSYEGVVLAGEEMRMRHSPVKH